MNYEGDLSCEWTIEAEYGYNVALTFLTFEVEEERECSYDYVEVYDSMDNSGTNYGKLCGKTVGTEIIQVSH